MNDQEGLAIALEEAKIGYQEGGVPVSITRQDLPTHKSELSIDWSGLSLKGWKIAGAGSQLESSEGLSYPPCT
jgi:hypothetical protein